MGPKIKEEQISETCGGAEKETRGRIRDDRILSIYYSANVMNLPSVRLHKTESVLSSREMKQGAVTIWHDMSRAMESMGDHVSPPGWGALHQPRLPGAEKAEGMKK